MGDHEEAPRRVKFHFVKSSLFRVIHSDGVWGGLSPRGLMTLSFFNERLPIPQAVEHAITDGTLGDEVARHGRDGIVREVEFEAIMTIEAAKSLRDWLDQHITKGEALVAEARKQDESRASKGAAS